MSSGTATRLTLDSKEETCHVGYVLAKGMPGYSL
jgi:hypothetical protein